MLNQFPLAFLNPVRRHPSIRVAIFALGLISLLTAYIASQQPNFWCNRLWVGMSLHKGHYRSWSVRFCDGEAIIDSKLTPVVIETNRLREGCYRWPQYRHVDMKDFTFPAGWEEVTNR